MFKRKTIYLVLIIIFLNYIYSKKINYKSKKENFSEVRIPKKLNKIFTNIQKQRKKKIISNLQKTKIRTKNLKPKNTIKTSKLKNFKNHSEALAKVTQIIHEQMKKIKTKSKPSILKYNNLRSKLIKLSKIYKKKYPNCLPIPTYIIDQKIDKINNKKDTEECEYAFFLGYNVVINWLKIINSLKLKKKIAWEKLSTTQINAFYVKYEKEEDIQRKILFKLKGECFAKGMKICFDKNFGKGETYQFSEIKDPRNTVKNGIKNMEDFMNKLNLSLKN